MGPARARRDEADGSVRLALWNSWSDAGEKIRAGKTTTSGAGYVLKWNELRSLPNHTHSVKRGETQPLEKKSKFRDVERSEHRHGARPGSQHAP